MVAIIHIEGANKQSSSTQFVRELSAGLPALVLWDMRGHGGGNRYVRARLFLAVSDRRTK
jgi:hypothetical protein